MAENKIPDEAIYALMERVRGGEHLSDVLKEMGDARPISRAGFYKRVNANPEMKATWREIIADSGDVWAEKADATVKEMLDGKQDPHKAKVAIEHFRWRAEKANPQRYGQRQTLEHLGDQGSYLEALQRAQGKMDEAKKAANVVALPVKGSVA